jgi:hypothetical protein
MDKHLTLYLRHPRWKPRVHSWLIVFVDWLKNTKARISFSRTLAMKFSFWNQHFTKQNQSKQRQHDLISGQSIKRQTLLLRSIPHFYQIRIAYKFFWWIFSKKSELIEIIHSYINFVLFLFLVIHFNRQDQPASKKSEMFRKQIYIQAIEAVWVCNSIMSW